VLNM